jgi:hypothetical protein
MPKAKKLLVDEVRGGRYVRAWKEGRSDLVVQVWKGSKPDGEPSGDWAMPAVLGLEAAVAQAVLQTKEDEE